MNTNSPCGVRRKFPECISVMAMPIFSAARIYRISSSSWGMLCCSMCFINLVIMRIVLDGWISTKRAFTLSMYSCAEL